MQPDPSGSPVTSACRDGLGAWTREEADVGPRWRHHGRRVLAHGPTLLSVGVSHQPIARVSPSSRTPARPVVFGAWHGGHTRTRWTQRRWGLCQGHSSSTSNCPPADLPVLGDSGAFDTVPSSATRVEAPWDSSCVSKRTGFRPLGRPPSARLVLTEPALTPAPTMRALLGEARL